ENLGGRLRGGKPLLRQRERVFFHQAGVGVNEARRDDVLRVQIVVHLGHDVVTAIRVGKIVVDEQWVRSVGGETRIAGKQARVVRSTGCQAHAERVARRSAGRQRIRNADVLRSKARVRKLRHQGRVTRY